MPKFDKPDSPNIIWGVNALEDDLTRPDDSYIQTGWTQVKPPYEYENYSMNKLYQGFAYYNQLGIPEWDSVTEYQAGKSYVQGGNGRLYKCIQTNSDINPTSSGNSSYWEGLVVSEAEIKTVFSASGTAPVFACRAWANFDGRNGVNVRASGNVESITRVSAGLYQVTFSFPMPDEDYAVTFGVATDNTTGQRTVQDQAGPYDFTPNGFKIQSFDDSDRQEDLGVITFSVVR